MALVTDDRYATVTRGQAVGLQPSHG
jgi:hypothetical protein